MGMFEAPEKFSDHFREGEVFLLDDVKMGQEIATEYGKDRPVLMRIGGKWYSMFGQGLTNQVEMMEPSDLPARVSLQRVETGTKGREVKRLVPVDDTGTMADEATDAGGGQPSF